MKQYFNSAKSGLNGLGDQTSRFGEQVSISVGTVSRLKFLYWGTKQSHCTIHMPHYVSVTGCMTKKCLDNLLFKCAECFLFFSDRVKRCFHVVQCHSVMSIYDSIGPPTEQHLGFSLQDRPEPLSRWTALCIYTVYVSPGSIMFKWNMKEK